MLGLKLMKRLDHIFQSILNVEEEIVNQKIEFLSGGETNMLQLAKVSASKANVLLLDEPTSHFDRDYLETEQKKKSVETKIELATKKTLE